MSTLPLVGLALGKKGSVPMNTKPVLVVLAAGLGSRYGGLKQLEPVGSHGQLIIDYSIYDAKRAGFEEVVFVIRPENQEAFEETIGKRIGNHLKVTYAPQVVADLPQGYALPAGRTKPWGTAHAALCAGKFVSGNFAIINADDFYGAEAYVKIYDFLAQTSGGQFGLVGYALKNTVTEFGTVSRGVCTVDENQKLLGVVEHTHIEKGDSCPRFTLDKGETWTDISGDSVVSMNLWGFTSAYLKDAQKQFQDFLDNDSDPMTKEFYLPSVADLMIQEKKAEVSVMTSKDLWYGITYPQDRPQVVEALAEFTKKGLYPENLWA